MQIPLWLFLVTVLSTLTYPYMASLLLKGLPTTFSSAIKASSPFAFRYNPQSFFTHLPNPKQPFSTTPSTMSGSAPFLEAVKNRRSVYQLKKESTISDAKIEEIVTQAILHVPSSFNSQSTRIVILLKEEHVKLWEIAKEVLKAIVPAESYAATEQRLNGFQNAYGSVLFFVNRPSVAAMQEKFALYADRFPAWATHSDGMHQYAIWTALEKEGLGANLQHYNPLIDQKVAATWGIDKDWELSAQLVFGTPVAPAGEKTFLDVKERLKVFGA